LQFHFLAKIAKVTKALLLLSPYFVNYPNVIPQPTVHNKRHNRISQKYQHIIT
jgi:hypothetical protein